MELLHTSPRSCEALLAVYRLEGPIHSGEALYFDSDKDVYNITSPIDGDIIAGRLDERDSEFSQVRFFSEHTRTELPAPIFNLQDPFFSYHEGDIVVGGVHLMSQEEGQSTYRTEFYKGPDIQNLEWLANGPVNEKDIRLIELSTGVGIMRRPQGGIFRGGRMAWQEIPQIDGLDAALNLYKGPQGKLLPQNFEGNDWGGANQMFDINGVVGVLGHIARRDGIGNRHYYPIAFQMDPKTLESTPMRILAEARDCPDGKPAKKPDLEDVMFAGGLVRRAGDMATLYVGLKDTYAARINIPDPFDGRKQQAYETMIAPERFRTAS